MDSVVVDEWVEQRYCDWFWKCVVDRKWYDVTDAVVFVHRKLFALVLVLVVADAVTRLAICEQFAFRHVLGDNDVDHDRYDHAASDANADILADRNAIVLDDRVAHADANIGDHGDVHDHAAPYAVAVGELH